MPVKEKVKTQTHFGLIEDECDNILFDAHYLHKTWFDIYRFIMLVHLVQNMLCTCIVSIMRKMIMRNMTLLDNIPPHSTCRLLLSPSMDQGWTEELNPTQSRA